MSAWVCTNAHVDYIIAATVSFDRRRELPMSPTEAGRLLLQENVRSVLHRYGPDALSADEVAAYARQIEQYTFSDVATLTPVAALKLLASWQYQTCETPDFKETSAWGLAEKIRSLLVAALPGYDTAPWSL